MTVDSDGQGNWIVSIPMRYDDGQRIEFTIKIPNQGKISVGDLQVAAFRQVAKMLTQIADGIP